MDVTFHLTVDAAALQQLVASAVYDALATHSGAKSSDRYLTYYATAKMLGVSRPTLKKWMDAGFLHPSKLRGRWMFSMREIEDFVGKNRYDVRTAVAEMDARKAAKVARRAARKAEKEGLTLVAKEVPKNAKNEPPSTQTYEPAPDLQDLFNL